MPVEFIFTIPHNLHSILLRCYHPFECLMFFDIVMIYLAFIEYRRINSLQAPHGLPTASNYAIYLFHFGVIVVTWQSDMVDLWTSWLYIGINSLLNGMKVPCVVIIRGIR